MGLQIPTTSQKHSANNKIYISGGTGGGVEAGLKGDINYNFSDKKLVGEIYFPPVILFANIHIETKGSFEFELVDFQKSIEITDKFSLYEYNKQF